MYKRRLQYKKKVIGSTAYRRAAAANVRALARSKAQHQARNSFAPTSRVSALVPETKYFDVGINADVTAAGTTWADTEVPADNYINSSGSPAAYTDSALIPSAVGSGYGQVNGNRYKLKKLRVRGHVSYANPTGGAVSAIPVAYRLLLVMDTQPNGAQAQGEDVLADFGTNLENLYAFKNTSSSSGRFRILKDLMGMLVPQTSVNNASAATISTSFRMEPFSFQYVPRTPIQVNIKSGNSTPTVAGLESCNIFMLAYAVDEAGSIRVLTVAGCSRAYYCD